MYEKIMKKRDKEFLRVESEDLAHLGLLALLPRGLSIMKTHKHSMSYVFRKWTHCAV